MRTEHTLERSGLGHVVGRGAGAVGVDVLNMLDGKLRVGERALNRARHPIFGRVRNVHRIGAHAKSDDLAKDACAAPSRPLKRLQHEDRGAFAKHHAFPVLRERTAGVGRHDAHGLPYFHRAERDCELPHRR